MEMLMLWGTGRFDHIDEPGKEPQSSHRLSGTLHHRRLTRRGGFHSPFFVPPCAARFSQFSSLPCGNIRLFIELVGLVKHVVAPLSHPIEAIKQTKTFDICLFSLLNCTCS
jgi:hypothetical protein